MLPSLSGLTCAIHRSSGSSWSKEWVGERERGRVGERGANNGEFRSRGGRSSPLVDSLPNAH